MRKTGSFTKCGAVLALLLTVLFIQAGMSAYAADTVSGTGWTLDNAGTLTITADIAPQSTADGYEWAPYADQIRQVVAAEGVTVIPALAFCSSEGPTGLKYSKLEKAVMSSTVRSIGVSAFYGNPTLTDVQLNDGLEEIWNVAFGLAGFTGIDLPAAATYYSDVFYKCGSLTSVTIPSGSQFEGNAHFYDCDSLSSVVLEEGVTEIPDDFLAQCSSLKSITIPRSVIQISDFPITSSDGVRIIGYPGTAAEEYANREYSIQHGFVFEIAPCAQHSYGDWETTEQPSCTENGLKKHICVVCGAEETETIPAAGHVWDNGSVTKQPTKAEQGEKTYTCTVCGTTKTEPIAALQTDSNVPAPGNGSASGQSSNPLNHENTPDDPAKTGNTDLLPLWAGVFTAAGIAAMTAYKKLDKKRMNSKNK